MPAPVEFHPIGPRRHAIVLPKGVAAISFAIGIEPGPAAHSRTTAIRSNDPSSPDFVSTQMNFIGRNAGHRRLPQQFDSQAGGAIRDDLVQDSAAHAHTRSVVRNRGIDSQSRTRKTNAAERIGFFCGNWDSEPFKGRETIRHQTFAAGLINRPLRTICDDYPKSLLPCRNGRGQSRGTPAYYEYIGRNYICGIQQLPTLTTLKV